MRGCLELATEAEPEYAEAWAILSAITAHEHAMGFNPRPNSLQRALRAARTGVELDPNNALTQAYLAYVLYFLQQPEFFDVAEKSVALNPNDPTTLAFAGFELSWAGEWERGVALAKKAIALSPHPGLWYYFPLAYNEYYKREYEAALAWNLKIDMPGFFWTYLQRAAIYGHMGRTQEAQAAIAHLLKLYPNIGDRARAESRIWFWEKDFRDHLIDGLRKAGLEIPDEG